MYDATINASDHSSAVIEVDALNVVYGEFDAVKDLSFQVERGELYALLGHSSVPTGRARRRPWRRDP